MAGFRRNFQAELSGAGSHHDAGGAGVVVLGAGIAKQERYQLDSLVPTLCVEFAPLPVGQAGRRASRSAFQRSALERG